MSVGHKKALEFAHQNRDQFLEELIRFAAIPSISTDPGFKNDVERSAQWLSDKFSSLGLENVRIFRWEIIQPAGNPPSVSDHNSPWTQAYFKAAESVWGVRPSLKREGGSVPVVTDFQQTLGVNVVNIGFGLPTDNMHGPNEKLDLPN
jgi:acetylornithine deacetylase/succinyl-diaminopimelate desuccinylase-like protein